MRLTKYADLQNNIAAPPPEATFPLNSGKSAIAFSDPI